MALNTREKLTKIKFQMDKEPKFITTEIPSLDFSFKDKSTVWEDTRKKASTYTMATSKTIKEQARERSPSLTENLIKENFMMDSFMEMGN